MINPSAVDVIDAIASTIETLVKPDLVTTDSRSAMATIGHLLRHIRQRLLLEGQILLDDIADQRNVLAATRSWPATEAPASPSIAEIDMALARTYREAHQYPHLVSLGAEAGTLRRALTNALEQLVALRATHGQRHGYRMLRSDIRDYIARQIRAETPLIDPAFLGQGPRR